MKKLFPLLVMLLMSQAAAAQDLQVTSPAAPSQVKLAHPFALQYQVTYPTQGTVSFDNESIAPDFEVTQAVFTPNTPGQGTYDLTVVPFALGKSTFTITFLLTQNEKILAKATSELPLDIAPANVFRDKKLREIRSPRLPSNWWKWFLALIAAVILGYILLNRRKHNQGPHAIRLEEDKRPCDQIALSKIKALLASGLWERKEYKLFYITLSDILREYLWRQFKIDVSADTSAELMRHVKNIPEMHALLMPLRDFLNSSDLVKFAKVEPTENVRNRDIQILRDLVQATTPREILDPKEKHV